MSIFLFPLFFYCRSGANPIRGTSLSSLGNLRVFPHDITKTSALHIFLSGWSATNFEVSGFAVLADSRSPQYYQTTTWLAMNPVNLFTVPRHSPGSCDGKELTESLFLSARPPPDLYQAVGYRVDESPRSPSNKATIFRYRCAGSSGTPIGPAGWGDPLSDFDCRQSVVMAR